MNTIMRVVAAGMLLHTAVASDADAAGVTRRTLVAAVSAAGTLLPGGDAKAIYHGQPGYYSVFFPLSAHPFCSTSVVEFAGEAPYFISASVSATQLYDVVLVYVQDVNGVPQATDFYVNLVC
jgi:hypothetical protein